jgi:hypothetical protein
MGGIGILFCIGLYLAVSIVAIVKVKPFWVKGLVLVPVILLPTADAVYGRYKLKQMCAEEGGTKIYRTIDNVDGFYGYARKEFVENHGYDYVENCIGDCYRWQVKNGDLQKTSYLVPKSEYEVVALIDNPNYKKKYWYARYQIESISDHEVLARHTNISFVGGWAEHFLGSFADAGADTVASCEQESFDLENFIITVLKP